MTRTPGNNQRQSGQQSIGMIGLVCLLLALFMVGCEDKKPHDRPKYSWFHPPSEVYPEGSVEVQQGETRFLLPRGALGNVSPDGHITIGMIWPEFEFLNGKKGQQRTWEREGRQFFIDTIEIFFNPPFDDSAAAHKQRQMQVIEKIRSEMESSTEFPNFYEYKDKYSGKPQRYLPIDKTIVDPQGLPLHFFCSTFNLDVDWDKVETVTEKLPDCETQVKWPDGHELRLRFRRKHMKDAIEIYQKVIALHDSFVVHAETNQPTGKQQGE